MSTQTTDTDLWQEAYTLSLLDRCRLASALAQARGNRAILARVGATLKATHDLDPEAFERLLGLWTAFATDVERLGER